MSLDAYGFPRAKGFDLGPDGGLTGGSQHVYGEYRMASWGAWSRAGTGTLSASQHLLSFLVPPMPTGSIVRVFAGASLGAADAIALGITTDPTGAALASTWGSQSGATTGAFGFFGSVRSRALVDTDSFSPSANSRSAGVAADFAKSNRVAIFYTNATGTGIVDYIFAEVFIPRVYR